MARQPLEDREYEVNAAQLRWRLAQLSAAGVPIQGYQQGQGNVYIITVQQPAAAPPLDWQAMQTRPRRGDDGLRRLTIALGVLIIAGAALWLLWSVLAANGVHMPWQGAPGEPAVTAPEPAGWALPGHVQPVADAAGAVSEALTLALWVALAALTLAGLWLLRGVLGPMARGAAQLVQGIAGRLRR